jgi:glycosyltransferase involved in cell wall biosynthesis
MTRDVIWWPDAEEEAARVTVVTVSYNTRDLTALLLWSLHRVLEWRALDVVVVDNGSTDGSAELLAQARDAGLCDLIANDANVSHGPALNQALSWLAGRRGPSAQWAWVLDSDCVIARPDTLQGALSVVEGSDPALVGEPGWDPWHQCETLGLYSLLLRPSRVWQPPVTPFSAGGNPIHDMLMSARAAGLVTKPFGFTAEGYVIHRGRGSLAAVAANEERTNPLYAWACDHSEPHFNNVPGARQKYRDLLAAFRSDLGIVTGDSLVRSCLRHRR